MTKQNMEIDECPYAANNDRMQVAGNESVIENNLFLHNDWTGHTPGNGATLYTQVHHLHLHHHHPTQRLDNGATLYTQVHCYLQHHIHHPKQRLDNAAALFSQAFSTNDVVIHNTFISNGKEAGIRLGDRPRIQYNEIVGQCKGRIANDGAAVQVHSNQKKGCTVHTADGVLFSVCLCPM